MAKAVLQYKEGRAAGRDREEEDGDRGQVNTENQKLVPQNRAHQKDYMKTDRRVVPKSSVF